MKKVLFLILISVLVICSCNRKANRTAKKSKSRTTKVVKKGIDFNKGTSYATILRRAKSQNKPIFIDFYTTWCAPCKWMDKDVFQLDQVGQLFNDNFVNLKVDAEKGEGPMLAQQFGVVGFPTLIYLDSNGDVVESQLGGAGATAIMDKARRTISHNKAINGAGSR